MCYLFVFLMTPFYYVCPEVPPSLEVSTHRYEVVIPYIRLNPDPHRCPHEGSPRIQNIVALAAGYMAITIFPYQLQN